MDTYGASVRQACQCVLVSRSSYYYRSHGRDDSAERPEIIAPDQVWSMDFVAYELFKGRRIRALTVVDNFSRQSLAIDVDFRLNGEAVVETMMRLLSQSRRPKRIQVNNGSVFVSRPLDKWAYEHGVELDFSRPGKPTDNAFIESFNGSFRDECLNLHWLLDLEDARQKIETWRRDHNEFRPRSSLGGQTPQMIYDTNKEAETL